MSGKEQAVVLAFTSLPSLPSQNILVSLILSASSYPVAADDIVPKDKVLESWTMWFFAQCSFLVEGMNFVMGVVRRLV